MPTSFWFIKLVGYGRIGGTKATAEDLERRFSAMEQNGLLKPTRILTGTLHPRCKQYPQISRIVNGPWTLTIWPLAGYIFGAEALSVVEHTVTKMLQREPHAIYLLDREQLSCP